MNIRILSSIALSAIVAVAAYGDNLPSSNSLVDQQINRVVDSDKVIFIDGKPSDEVERQHQIDSLRIVVRDFYYEQFRHFQDPDAPYFLFMSKDAQLAMGIGGCVRMRGYYDWGGAVPASGFAPYLIPMTPDPTNMRVLGTTPAGSSLFFRIIGRNKKVGNYQLYIEANFNGYGGRDFQLKKAYALINDWTVGYAPSTFSDPAAVPPTVDAQGPSNKITPTSVLLRWMPTVKNRWVFALSAETPSTAIDVDNSTTRKVSNWLPDWAAFVQYQWAKGQHVRLSGILRTLSYRDVTAEKNYNPVGWGLQASSVAHPAPQITTYATLSYGNGIESLGGDLQIDNYDLIPDPTRPGHLYAPASLGWCVGVQYNFLPNLFMSVSASQTYFMPRHDVPADEYKNGLFADINIFWNLTPRMQVGAEFDLGRRENHNGAKKWARRIGAMAQFSF